MMFSEKLLDTLRDYSLSDILNNGSILRLVVFSGTVPTLPESAEGGATELFSATNLSMATSLYSINTILVYGISTEYYGALTAPITGTALATGTSTFWRIYVDPNDTGADDETAKLYPRMQGEITETFLEGQRIVFDNFLFSLDGSCLPATINTGSNASAVLNGSQINGFAING